MSKTMPRATPSNVEAEQSLLGAVLLEPDKLFWLDLKPCEFYLEKHRWIYEAMGECAAANKRADILSVATLLQGRDRLAALGGMAYLTSLLSSVQTASLAEQAAALVRHASLQRKAIDVSTELAELAYNSSAMQTDELITQAHALVQTLEAQPKERGVTMLESARELSDAVDEFLANPRETFGVPTHLAIDDITNGLSGGQFIVLVADPGMGKTALLHQIMANIGTDGVRSRLYSFEMKHTGVTMRLACNLASVNSKLVRRGQVSPEETERLHRAIGQVSGLPIRIVDVPCTMEQIQLDLLRDERAGTLPAVVGIDYSKLLTDKGENEIIRIGKITGMGKQIAMRFDTCVIMIHVLNGDSAREDRMPELRDLGWSRQSQYDPDIVIATRLSGNKAAVAVVKNREGEWGNGLGVNLNFIPQFTRWENPQSEGVSAPRKYTWQHKDPVFSVPPPPDDWEN